MTKQFDHKSHRLYLIVRDVDSSNACGAVVLILPVYRHVAKVR